MKNKEIHENAPVEEESNVIVRTASIFNPDVLDVLEKGKNFVPAPRDISETVFDTEIGIERLAYAMRCKDLAGKFGNFNRFNKGPHPFKDVTKNFEKLDIRAVLPGNRETEKIIKNIRGAIKNQIEKVNMKSIKQNISKQERKGHYTT